MSVEPIAQLLKGQVILVVDDQAQIRSLIAQTLEARGAIVLEAVTGYEALVIRKRHPGPIALVIVDFIMPGLTGLDLAAQLSRDAPGLKILYMSSAVESIAMESIFRRSPELVLLKPFTVEILIDRVCTLLPGASASGR